MTWISQGIRGISEKKCNQDTKKELKWGHLDISRNMKEILKQKQYNNPGYRKIELVKKSR